MFQVFSLKVNSVYSSTQIIFQLLSKLQLLLFIAGRLSCIDSFFSPKALAFNIFTFISLSPFISLGAHYTVTSNWKFKCSLLSVTLNLLCGILCPQWFPESLRLYLLECDRWRHVCDPQRLTKPCVPSWLRVSWPLARLTFQNPALRYLKSPPLGSLEVIAASAPDSSCHLQLGLTPPRPDKWHFYESSQNHKGTGLNKDKNGPKTEEVNKVIPGLAYRQICHMCIEAQMFWSF